MKKYLFIIGRYYPKSSANSNCLKRIQSVLFKQGIATDILCMNEKMNEKNTIEKQTYGNIFFADECYPKYGKNIIINFVIKLKRYLLWPVRNPKEIINYRKALIKIINKNKYDNIIAVVKPLTSAIACLGVCNFSIICFDSIVDNPDNFGLTSIFKHRASIIEHKLFMNSNKVFLMQSYKRLYESKKYIEYKDKFVFVDIPSFAKINKDNNERIDKKEINMLYCGTLNNKTRSPYKAIDLLKKLNNYLNIKILLYTAGDCENRISELAKTNNFIKQMGYVDKNKVEEVIRNVDILINFGSTAKKRSNCVASKIFEYISFSKPIISFFNDENDIEIEYLKKYPLALNVYYKDNDKINLTKLIDFIKENESYQVLANEINESFIKNTPEYFAEVFLNEINK